MQYKYYIADVFTCEPFNGAQIAVFPNADGLNQAQMQLLARELNLSETAFVFSPVNGSKHRRLRCFSPKSEIDFAGHPIIAVGHVLTVTHALESEGDQTNVVFEQNTGPVEVNIMHYTDKPDLIQFKLETQAVIDRYVPMEAALADMLGLEETDIEKHKYQTLLSSSEHTYLVIPLRSFAAVRRATFNYSVWSQSIAPECMAREILLFSTQSDNPSSNFHARLVGPDIGINEDPPVATAMPAFTGYLCSHKHVSKGTHAFVIDRGLNSTRKSVLSIEMDNKVSGSNIVRVGGPAVMIGEGTINLPDNT